MFCSSSSSLHWLLTTPEISLQDHAPSDVEAVVREEHIVRVCNLVAGPTKPQPRYNPVDECVAK